MFMSLWLVRDAEVTRTSLLTKHRWHRNAHKEGEFETSEPVRVSTPEKHCCKLQAPLAIPSKVKPKKGRRQGHQIRYSSASGENRDHADDDDTTVDWINRVVNDPLVEIDPVTMSQHLVASQGLEIGPARRLYKFVGTPISSSCQQFPWPFSCVPPPRGLGNVLLALGASLVLASIAATTHLFRGKEHKQDKLVSSRNQKLQELVSHRLAMADNPSSDEESKLDLRSIHEEQRFGLQHYDQGNGAGILSTSQLQVNQEEEVEKLAGNTNIEILEKKLKVENGAGQVELTERDLKLKNGKDVLEQVQVKERVVIVAPEVALAAAFVTTALKDEFLNQVVRHQHLLRGSEMLEMQPKALPETSTDHMEDNLDMHEDNTDASHNKVEDIQDSDSSQAVCDKPNRFEDIKEVTQFDKAEDTGVAGLYGGLNDKLNKKSDTDGSNNEVIISEVFSVQGETLERYMADSAKSLVLDDLEVFEKGGELGVPSTGSNKSELRKQLELLVVAAFALIFLGVPGDDDLTKAEDGQGGKGELTKAVQAAVPAVAVGAGAMSIITGVNGALEMVGLAATASFIYFDLLYYESRKELCEEIKKIKSHAHIVEFLRSKKIIQPEDIL